MSVVRHVQSQAQDWVPVRGRPSIPSVGSSNVSRTRSMNVESTYNPSGALEARHHRRGLANCNDYGRWPFGLQDDAGEYGVPGDERETASRGPSYASKAIRGERPPKGPERAVTPLVGSMSGVSAI